MKREKRLTKRERKAISPGPKPPVPQQGGHHHHIHCTACGKHLDEDMFEGDAPSATWMRCDHNSEFASCTACAEKTRLLLAEHDATGQPVKQASAWH